MSAYSTVDDVRGLLQEMRPVTTESRPNAAQVTVWITQVSSVVNVALSDVGETVPPTPASDLETKIKLCVAKEVAYMVLQSAGVASDPPRLALEWHEDFKSLLKDIAGLTTGSGTSTAGYPESYTMDALTHPEDKSIQPYIEKEMDL